MMKINKIVEKEMIEVLAQENCTVSGKPSIYIPGQNCLKDCSAVDKPQWWKNKAV